MQCGHCTGAQPLNVLYVKVRGAGSIERTPRKVKRGAPEHVLDSIARISASSTRIPEEPAADAKTRLDLCRLIRDRLHGRLLHPLQNARGQESSCLVISQLVCPFVKRALCALHNLHPARHGRCRVEGQHLMR